MQDAVEMLETVSRSVVTVDGRRGYALSGVVYAADTGASAMVVTTSRAVEEETAQVGTADGRTLSATLVGRDPATDLAVLKLEGAAEEMGLEPIVWAEMDTLKVGQTVFRVGRPGDTLRATKGILGGLGGAWHTRWGGRVDARLYTDAAAFRGFSGGPLVTLNGETVGLNTAALNRAGDAVVPSATVRRVVGALLEHGRVRRGYLGLGGQSVRLPAEIRERSGQRAGLMVVSVEAEGPAAQAGLVLGDILLKYGGEAVYRPGHLLAQLDETQVGKALGVELLRGGEIHALSVTVGERA
ncbi:trypsin-like peptidase domain-containing protein [soil metagenome]